MSKKSTSEVLVLLGNIALLNEEIMDFLFWCSCESGYDELPEADNLIMDERFERILQSTADITVEHGQSSAFLQAAYCKALEKQDLKTAKKVSALHDRLLALVAETGGEKAGTE